MLAGPAGCGPQILAWGPVDSFHVRSCLLPRAGLLPRPAGLL